jgi:hypothetical protein
MSGSSSSTSGTVSNVRAMKAGYHPSSRLRPRTSISYARSNKHYVLVLEDLNSQRTKSQRVKPQSIRLCFKQHILDHIAQDLLEKEDTDGMTNDELHDWIESRVDARNEQLTFRVSDSTKKLAAAVCIDTTK